MKHLRSCHLLSLLLLSVPCAKTFAQTTLIDWNHSWNYMHPMGAMPDRPGGGADPDFDTTWFLKAADFAAQYDGPTIGPPQAAGVPGTPASYDHGAGPGP